MLHRNGRARRSITNLVLCLKRASKEYNKCKHLPVDHCYAPVPVKINVMTEIVEDSLEQRLRQRTSRGHPLDTIPVDLEPHGNIPNTPLAASTISFFLGAVFSMGTALFLCGGLNYPWWATYQLGYFLAAWSAFHWSEFAVTAGWNREKCSVDCEFAFLVCNVSLIGRFC